MARSSSDILTEVLTYAKSIAPQLQWSPKTAPSDLLAISAVQQAKLWAIAEYVKYLSGLSGYEKLYSDSGLQQNIADALGITKDQFLTLLRTDLVNFAEVYGFIALDGIKARGVCKFIFNSATSVSVALGTVFYSVVGERKYLTAESVSSKVPDFDTSRGGYYINIMLEAEEVGANYNLVANSTVKPEVSIPGFITGLFKADVTNGSDQETVQEFVDRIRVSRQSRGIGSKAFLYALLLGDSRVYDVAIYSVNDIAKFARNYGVDIWMHAAETPKSVTERTTNQWKHVLLQQPLIEDDPIETVGYSLTRERGSNYYNSVLAVDSVRGPLGNVTYYADDTIRQMQLLLEDPDNWLFGGRSLVLIKKALRVLIGINATIYLHDGYVASVVKAQIVDNLQKYFTGGTTSYGKVFSRVTISQDVDKSDIFGIIQQTEGVDRVTLEDFTVLRDDGLYPTQDPLTIKYNEYAYLGDTTLTDSKIRRDVI